MRAHLRLSLALLVASTGGCIDDEDPAAPEATIDPAILAIADAYDLGGPPAARDAATRRGSRISGSSTDVTLIIEPRRGMRARDVDRDRIGQLGTRVEAMSSSFIRVRAPFASLRLLASLPDVSRVRLPVPHKALTLGTASSESVALTGADNLHAAGVRGAGSKVAVVDLGFIGFSNAITAGELPASTVTLDLTGTGIAADTEHGTGVAEHVMDMAPDASLYLIKVGDEVDLQNAADYIRDNGIQIANHSVGWVNSSYYDDTGPINAIINHSRDVDGVFWSVAAGNDAGSHWRGGWSDVDADNLLELGGTDEAMGITTASSYVQLFLNWNQYGASVTDLDLYARNRTGAIVARSEGAQTGAQEPSEAISFTYSSAAAPYTIEVRRYSGPTAGLDLTIFSFNNNLEHSVATSSLMDPAGAHGAFTVAAIDQANWAAATIEPFSSQGPTTDGRTKPDLTAPDGTTSLIYGYQGAYGTSFSSPTVAGAAALLYSQEARSATALTTALAAAAEDVGAPGADPVFGAGKLQLVAGPPGNQAPTADAGSDVTLADADGTGAESIALDGSGNDADGTVVSYEWREGTAVLGAEPTLAGAFAVGSHTLSLTVTDDLGASATDSVVVTVAPNQAPSANAGADRTVTDADKTGAESLTLTGSGGDADGSVVGYQWREGATVLGTTNVLTSAFAVGAHTLTLTVTDNGGAATLDTVVVTVNPAPPPALITIASDGFESNNWSGGTGWTGVWAKSGDYVITTAAQPHGGTRHVRLRRDTGLIQRSVNLTGRTNVRLRVWVKLDSFEGSDRAFIKFSSNGTSWTTLRTLTPADGSSWKLYELVLPGPMTSTARIAVDAEMSATNDNLYVDDIAVVGN